MARRYQRNSSSQTVLDNYIKEVTSTTTLTISGLAALREAEKHEAEKLKKQKDEPDESRPAEANRFHTITWKVAAQNVGMGVGGSEIVASMFQSANSLYILIFGLVFTAIWAFLSARGMEPSTPVKFALALVQVGLGFLVLWYGANLYGRCARHGSHVVLAALYLAQHDRRIEPIANWPFHGHQALSEILT